MDAQEDAGQLKALTNLLKVEKRLKPGETLAQAITALIKENESLRKQCEDEKVKQGTKNAD